MGPKWDPKNPKNWLKMGQNVINYRHFVDFWHFWKKRDRTEKNRKSLNAVPDTFETKKNAFFQKNQKITFFKKITFLMSFFAPPGVGDPFGVPLLSPILGPDRDPI